MRLLIAVMVGLAGTACATATKRESPAQAVANDALVDLHTVAGDFLWRQAITATYVEPSGKPGKGSFEAMLQKQGPTLTLVGLTPFGTRAFVATQEGSYVTLKEGDAQRLPFPPRFVFVDINRCFFVGLHEGSAPADGWHEQLFDRQQVRDLWQGGRLRERHLRAVDGSEPEVIITYADGYSAGGNPGNVRLRNLRMRYELDIRTLEAQRL